MGKMKDYDAKNISLEINGQELYGFGDPDFYFVKDNSKENQERLSEDFKYKQRQPLPSKQAIRMWCIRHFHIPERDY